MKQEALTWYQVPALVITVALPQPVMAVQYLSTEEAQKALFPDATAFVSRPVRLDDAAKVDVERYSKVRYRANEQPVWRVERHGEVAGWFIVDEVYGKHEFITYAVGLDAMGGVTGIEIMNYRESHGGEVRQPGWRAQFSGKHYGDELRLTEGIANIAGATLSCKHITEGVRRILAIYEAALK